MVRNKNNYEKEGHITRALGDFAANLDYEDLSPEVVDWAKYLCLDFAGLTLNGSTTGSVKAVVDALEGVGRSSPSTVVGRSQRVPSESAAMAMAPPSIASRWTTSTTKRASTSV